MICASEDGRAVGRATILRKNPVYDDDDDDIAA
jgi:hypothetical protein